MIITGEYVGVIPDETNGWRVGMSRDKLRKMTQYAHTESSLAWPEEDREKRRKTKVARDQASEENMEGEKTVNVRQAAGPKCRAQA